MSNSDQADVPWRNSACVAFGKGSVDGLLDITSQVWSGDQAIPLTDELRQRILNANDSLADNGQRVSGSLHANIACLS